VEILNKREKKLYKELKTRTMDEGTVTIQSEDFPKWTTLLNKLKSSGYFRIVYADNAAFIYKSSNFKQFEIEQKEASKEKRKISTHDYKVVIVSVVLTALIGFLSKNIFTIFMTESTDKYNEYCYEINKIIKDIDFDKGNIDDGKIVLHNDDMEVFNQDYEKFDSGLNIKYIRKDDDKIFFILNAAVDDEEGIVFVNDDTNSLMDGLGSLERLNGNSYMYKTFQ